MTVTYTLEVSQARFWGFPKLLARWRGSIYRLMYREMIFFIMAFYFVMFVYRILLDDELKRVFELVSVYCRDFTAVVPITFVMGFYVTFVVGRWWQQYINIPWPDRCALQISAYVEGQQERSRMIRRSLARYINLMTVLTFQSTSTVVKRRFPTIDHLVEAGLLTPEEKIELENTPTPHGVWWVPAHWFCQLATIARKENKIHDDLHLKSMIDDCLEIRSQCGMVWSYDWISVPLVYTQVVTIAVYSFFLASVFGRQYLFIEPDGVSSGHVVDSYFPVFTVFQFFFYVGWLKVAESMICPFGEDDDDFDMNWIIDRNLQVALLLVDGLHRKHPPLTRDIFWDHTVTDIPHTLASAKYRAEPFFGSTTAMDMAAAESEWAPEQQMSPITEEEPEENKSDDGSVIDEDEPDAESVESRRVGRRKLRGLSGLLLGFSRQNLSQRFGSQKSLWSLNKGSSACVTKASSPQYHRRSTRKNQSMNVGRESYDSIRGAVSPPENTRTHSVLHRYVSESSHVPQAVREESEADEIERVRQTRRRKTTGDMFFEPTEPPANGTNNNEDDRKDSDDTLT